MKQDSRRKKGTQDYIQDLRKMKFSEFWSKVESALLKQFIGTGSEDAERNE